MKTYIPLSEQSRGCKAGYWEEEQRFCEWCDSCTGWEEVFICTEYDEQIKAQYDEQHPNLIRDMPGWLARLDPNDLPLTSLIAKGEEDARIRWGWTPGGEAGDFNYFTTGIMYPSSVGGVDNDE